MHLGALFLVLAFGMTLCWHDGMPLGYGRVSRLARSAVSASLPLLP